MEKKYFDQLEVEQLRFQNLELRNEMIELRKQNEELIKELRECKKDHTKFVLKQIKFKPI